MSKRIINYIVTHMGAHMDEFLALYFLQNYGRKIYSNIENAEIIFWDGGKIPKELLENENYLFVGIGGGEFDEHPTESTERKKDVCSALLVAKKLGIANVSYLQEILEFTQQNDLNGGGNAFDIAHIAKTFFTQGEDPFVVMAWVTKAIEAKIEAQKEYLTEAKKEFAKARIESFLSQAKKEFKIAVIETESTSMSKYAFKKENCTFLVQKNSLGNVQIFTNKKYVRSIVHIVIAIRKSEILKKGLEIPSQSMNNEGEFPNVREWYFHPKLMNLMNGSLTAAKPPTKLSLEEIVDIIKNNV